MVKTMAKRRMFNSQIVGSDSFMDLPISAQALYFHLGMGTDDRGYVSNPKTIIRMIGASVGDLESLINKKFVLLRDNGLILIKHFKINNYIQSDRFKETTYIEDLKKLFYDENNSYTERPTNTPCIQNVYKVDTQYKLNKNNINEYNILPHTHVREEEEQFKPTLEEIELFIKANDFKIDPKDFYNYYNSSDWKINGQAIKNWKVLLRTWEHKTTSPSSNVKIAGKPDWLEEYEKNFETDWDCL
jgi:hypothetical protein